MKAIYLFAISLMLVSCTHKINEKEIQILSSQLVENQFDLKGFYVWEFDLMGSRQTSIHRFFSDSIVYEMKGKIHSTKYTMQKLSFEKENQKWIGKDENNIVYVLFFKDKTEQTISIYKHKCKQNGLQEAIDFQKPAKEATTDHGWNVYSKDSDKTKEVLAVFGKFLNEKNQLSISDKQITINGKLTEKMSFHSGERRWVGKFKNQFVQIFFSDLKKDSHQIKISITWFDDLEKLYKTKYNEVRNWENYVRK